MKTLLLAAWVGFSAAVGVTGPIGVSVALKVPTRMTGLLLQTSVL
jgi:hypothetical protein